MERVKTCDFFSVAFLDRLIVENLHRIRALPFETVVHIPRSGTIPASLIATYLARPLCSVEEYCKGIVSTRKVEVRDAGRILLVDDSLRTGKQMLQAVQRIKAHRPGTKISTCVVFLANDMRGDVRVLSPDLYMHEHGAIRYIFPWFAFKTPLVDKMAVDLDGVLCRDCLKDEDDDGAAYLRFLETAEPKFRPLNGTIGWIVTGRLGKYRAETEAWLRRNGISYNNLIMGPWNTKAERRGVAEWKGATYRGLRAFLFIESSEKQAETIARVSGKTVWSVETGQAHG